MVGWARSDATYKIAVMRNNEEAINVIIEPQRLHCFRYRGLHNNHTVKETLSAHVNRVHSNQKMLLYVSFRLKHVSFLSK